VTVSTASVPVIDRATAAAYARQQREHDEAHRRAHGGVERRPMSRGRVYAALLALALGGFGIGSTEFVAMGLLPEIARDLLPGLSAANSEAAIAQSGWVITAYALGVVVGAPTIAAFAGRVPRRRLLLWLAAAFTIGTVASATLPTFELVIAARFVSGLPHGAYFGVAALVAASLMGPGKRGQGVALVLSGLTVATVIGVPIITAVGQASGWRAAYMLVAALFAATFFAVRILVPWQPGDALSTVRSELAAFGSLQVWVAVAVGAIGFGGFFAVYSYIAPMVIDSAGMPGGAVPWVLASTGIGLTIGNIIGGRLADAGTVRAMFVGFTGLIGALALLGLTGTNPVGLIAGTFLVGFAASIISPVVQTRLMDVAGKSQTLAAALNHSALNVGNALGAFLGGLVVAAGWGYLTPAWVGLLLALGGMALALVSVALERRGAGLDPPKAR